jgi:hypothetical protein
VDTASRCQGRHPGQFSGRPRQRQAARTEGLIDIEKVQRQADGLIDAIRIQRLA